MGRQIQPPEGHPYWVASTGYTSNDFIEQGKGACHLHANIELDNLTWFASERLANGHPAVIAYNLNAEIQSQLAEVDKLKNPQAYSAKGFDAWRYRQAFPTKELSDAQASTSEAFLAHKTLPIEYKDMAIDIEIDELSAWDASGAILTAIDNNIRSNERDRKMKKKQLKESMPVE